METTCKFAYREGESMPVNAVVCHNARFGAMAADTAEWDALQGPESGTAHQQEFLKFAERTIDKLPGPGSRDMLRETNQDDRGNCVYCWGTTTADKDTDTPKDKDHIFWCVGMGTEAEVGGDHEWRVENLAKRIASPSECQEDDDCNRSWNKFFQCPRD